MLNLDLTVLFIDKLIFIAMGNPLCPVLANIFVRYFESILSKI